MRVIYRLAEDLLVSQDSAHGVRVSVGIVIQHAKHKRRIILLSVTCLALPYFFTLSRK